MKSIMKKAFALLLCIATLSLAQQPMAQPMPKRAPGFCLSDTKAQWHDLADYRGKVVLIEFMQTTCPHCAEFSNVLAKMTQKYGANLQVLSIALPQDTMPMLIQYTQGHKTTWPHLFDMGQVAFSYLRAPSVSFPTVFLVDQNGMIANKWEYGGLTTSIFDGTQLSREIDKLLGASAAPASKKK
jgi:peroxiredoxin